jgi:hypothetical protein
VYENKYGGSEQSYTQLSFTPDIELLNDLEFNVFKVFLKIGRTLIPDDHIKLNSDNPQNKEIMKTAIIETYTKAFLWN